jgi:hypothetical protein
MFVQSTDNHQSGQGQEMGNPASTSTTVIWNAKLILDGLLARRMGTIIEPVADLLTTGLRETQFTRPFHPDNR